MPPESVQPGDQGLFAPRHELSVLYQDDWMVAVDKPAGLLVHRNVHAGQEPFLLQLLRNRLGRLVYPVHRLDRATSGLMILALTPPAASVLARQFARHEISKTYLAVVRGFTPVDGTIDSPLRSDSGTLREARTDFVRLATTELPVPVGRYASARFSLVRVHPRTGRTHQIRRHFAHIRHPIIGDVLRGDGRQNRFFREHFGLHRLLLASIALSFAHPDSGEAITLTCPPGPELTKLFRDLGWPGI
jgi:tRNA pseudouridine65 synthase